jgi:hypothetical protein
MILMYLPLDYKISNLDFQISFVAKNLHICDILNQLQNIINIFLLV